jgi:hypothetical protein
VWKLTADFTLTSGRGVERFDDGEVRRIECAPALWVVDRQGAWWGYDGSGPKATAKILLEDACVIDASRQLCTQFAVDMLGQLIRVDPQWLTVEEVVYWHRERAPILVEQAERRAETAGDLGAEVERLEALAQEPSLPMGDWLRRHREERPPRLPAVPWYTT